MEQVAAALDERVEWLCRGLGDLGGVDILSPTTAERRAGILTFRLHGWDNAALFERLKAAQVVCALRGGGIRFSPHFYTPQRVIDETRRFCTSWQVTDGDQPARHVFQMRLKARKSASRPLMQR